MKSALRFLACAVLCLGIGYISGVSTRPSIPTWYASLAKPSWTPPNIAFPIVWTTLYALMALSLWLLWDRTAASAQRTRAIGLFLAQLVLNALWSPVFFAWHLIWPAFVIIVGMIVLVALTIRTAWGINRPAALMLVPYLVWISYASTLNAGIGIMNPR